jgi:tyrosyl-tRNA synthetase
MNVDDRDVERLLLQLTLVEVDEVASIVAEHRAAPEQRRAQRRLAGEVTALVHGEAAAQQAGAASAGFSAAVDELGADQLAALADEIPTHHLGPEAVGRDLAELAAELGIEKSRGAARRTIEQRGLYVNDVAAEPGQAVGATDLLHGRYVLLRKGKKSRFLLVISST